MCSFVTNSTYFSTKALRGGQEEVRHLRNVNAGHGAEVRCDCRSGPAESSLGMNQSTGSLAITEPFGPKVLGITRCKGNKQTIINELQTSLLHDCILT